MARADRPYWASRLVHGLAMACVQIIIQPYTSSTSGSTSVGTLLGQRRKQWANIVPKLGERLVFRIDNILTQCWFNPFSAGTDFRRQNMTSVDVIF